MSAEWSEGVEFRLCDLANSLLSDAGASVIHRAFGRHLANTANALRALSLELSDDTAEGSANDALMAVLTRADLLVEAVERAERAQKELNELLDQVQRSKQDPAHD